MAFNARYLVRAEIVSKLFALVERLYLMIPLHPHDPGCEWHILDSHSGSAAQHTFCNYDDIGG